MNKSSKQDQIDNDAQIKIVHNQTYLDSSSDSGIDGLAKSSLKSPQELQELDSIIDAKDMVINWERGNYLEKMLEDVDALTYSKWSQFFRIDPNDIFFYYASLKEVSKK